jgi:hypothetical protein
MPRCPLLLCGEWADLFGSVVDAAKDLPAHLRVISGRGAGRFQQSELAAATDVAQTAVPLLRRFEPELLGIERTRPREVLRGKRVATLPLLSRSSLFPLVTAQSVPRSRRCCHRDR